MKLILPLIVTSFMSFSQTEKLQEEKELDVVDFSTIKKVLTEDGLSEMARKREKQVQILKKEQSKIETKRFNYPKESEIWGFTTDFWLIKNAQVLSWDFEKPDFGIEDSFSKTLESLGFFQLKFKVLLTNSPSLVKTSLPGDNEFIVLLSLPFIRSLDLSKLEISLLLFEEFIRMEQGYFKKNVATEKLSKLAGSNFEGQAPDRSMIEELLKNYSNQIFEKGYSFQQMFEVTKKVDGFLKSKPELWNAYYRLLGKIDRFIKANELYKDYLRLYPSPEMQAKWLSPEEKIR